MADAEDTQTPAVADEAQEKAEEQTASEEQAAPEEQAPAEDADKAEEQAAEGGEGQSQEEAGGEEAAEAAQETQEEGEQQSAQEEAGEAATEDAAEEQAAAPEEPSSQQQEGDSAEPAAATEESQAQEEEQGEQQEAAAEEADQSQQQGEEEGQTAQQEVEESGQTQEEQPPVQISEEDKARCLTFFNRKAVDGRLDLKGFKILFRLMGQTLTSEEAESSFEAGSKDGNGTIDFEEFCALYAKNCEAEQQRKAAMAQSFDKIFPGLEGDEVDLRKVERLLMKMQQPELGMRLVREKSDLCATDIRSMLRTLDKNNSGKISKTDLVDQLCQHVDLE